MLKIFVIYMLTKLIIFSRFILRGYNWDVWNTRVVSLSMNKRSVIHVWCLLPISLLHPMHQQSVIKHCIMCHKIAIRSFHLQQVCTTTTTIHTRFCESNDCATINDKTFFQWYLQINYCMVSSTRGVGKVWPADVFGPARLTKCENPFPPPPFFFLLFRLG